ncbi:MAG: hypothetical protein IT463_01600 [Planctomycetes bacterium]|nr:hypothetical protein [Planctomycetota bacterium]
MLRPALCALLCSLLAPSLLAGLVETHFPGKAEADVAKDFEAGIGAFLQAALKDTTRPRLRMDYNKKPIFVELSEVKSNELTWATLARSGWYADRLEYSWSPHEPVVKLKFNDIPPACVAEWFKAPNRTPAEVVGVCVWLANKKELWTANALLAGLAKLQTSLKKEVDEWLVAKHGWTLPEGGLTEASTTNLESGEEGFLLLTTEAATERLKTLDKQAKDALKDLQLKQGEDVKSKPGQRKGTPKVRLDVLLVRVGRFEKAFAGTATAGNSKTKKTLEELTAAIKADLEHIENARNKADRMAIDGDAEGCARAYVPLVRCDPQNPDLLAKAADACSKGAGITNNGTSCEKKDLALQAAVYWEAVLDIYTAQLGLHNHAGLNFMAGGDKARAKQHFDEVLRRTEGKKELSDTEKQNRDYAEARLKDMK